MKINKKTHTAMLKSITLSLLTASLLYLPYEAKAEATEASTHSVGSIRSKNQEPNGNGRSRARSINKPLWCYYSNGQICFDLPADVEYMEVDITDANGCMWSGFISQDDPCCDMPPMSGTIYIEATTDTGATLSATLVF